MPLEKVYMKRPAKAKVIAQKLGVSESWVTHHFGQSRLEYELYSDQKVKPWEYFGWKIANWYKQGKPKPPKEWIEARKAAIKEAYEKSKAPN